MTDSRTPFDPAAEALFFDFQARVEAGEEPDFESVCRGHPGLADQLRQMRSLHDFAGALKPETLPDKTVVERLKEQFGDGVDPKVDLEPPSESNSGPSSRLFDKLRNEAPRGSRYRLIGEVSRGGMGAILRVRDEELHRNLAMKVILGQSDTSTGETPVAEPRQLLRFLEEAQITGQLDHPNIVPVHELGLDSQGRVFFTMRLIQGEHLGRAFEDVRKGVAGRTQVWALGVILKVCEAMAYAHTSKRVIHRDLKPLNIMVGDFGEVYVIDWGLARVLGPSGNVEGDSEVVFTDRFQERLELPGAPHQSREGEVQPGTPGFMSPEQVAGRLNSIGPHSDVYSVGAILYLLIAGEVPYFDGGKGLVDWHSAVRHRDPTPLTELAPQSPAELIAICEKAMAREITDRYSTMSELASDVRAYLEGRVVAAYEQGVWPAFRKWVVRNKGLSIASCLALVATILGTTLWVRSRIERLRAADDRERLLMPGSLLSRAEELWPVHPQSAPALDEWLRATDFWVPLSKSLLRRTNDRNLPPATDSAGTTLLRELPRRIQALEGAARGNSGIGSVDAWPIAKRLQYAREGAGLVVGPEQLKTLWNDAREAAFRSSKYGPLQLPQIHGLIPLGSDPFSGLLEFADVMSGEPPRRDRDGQLVTHRNTGLVFVLIPGGDTQIGAQRDPLAPNYDPFAREEEGPVATISLAPYLIAKYEMTQDQWFALSGEMPSANQPTASAFGVAREHLGLPVESVNWLDCRRVLQRFNMDLPTEAQWEHAARAGAKGAFRDGNDPAGVQGFVNLADATVLRLGLEWPQARGMGWLDDGHVRTAPVDVFQPNAFGLHSMIGNVWEWCHDSRSSYAWPVCPLNGLRVEGEVRQRVARGGGYTNNAEFARFAIRDGRDPRFISDMHGVRPIYVVDLSE